MLSKKIKMNQIFIKTILILIGFYQSIGYSQDSTSTWKWDVPEQTNEVLYIGTDTISKKAAPVIETDKWWEAFGYKELDSLIALALQNNEDLKIAQARVEQAIAQKRIAFSSLLPTLRLEPSVARQEFSANRPNPFGGQLDRVTINTFDIPLTVNYELDVFGKNIDNVKANRLAADASVESRKDILLQVITEVAQNYFLLLQVDAEKDLLKETEKTRLNNLEITTTRYEAGLVSQIDVLRAKTELSSVQVQIKRIHKLRTEIELILAPLVGVDASNFSIHKTEISYMPPDLIFLEKDSLTATRPDLKSAKLMLESSKSLVKNQWKQLLPSFYLNGAFGYLSGDSNNWIENDSRTWVAGVSASLPIFEGGKKRAEIKLRKSELKQAEAAYNQNVLVSYRQVENSISNIKWVHEQLLAQQEFVKAANNAAELTNERYRKGLINYIDVVDAERQALEAEQLSVQLFGQELKERVSLFKALGLLPDSVVE